MFDWFKPVNKTLDIVDQLVEDKDAAAKLKAQFYLAELSTKTVPIIDGIHKLGRQMLGYAQLGFYGYALKQGVEITPELVTGVSGVAALYTISKGRGR